MPTHVIVIGASMAGLCAARVLERSFDKVTLLDRDELPNGPAPRSGTPQARHVHALISRGARELERFFPGFLEEYKAKGAHEIDVSYEGAWLRATGWQRPLRSGYPVFFATRDLTEAIVRARVLALGKVEIRDRTEVTGLLMDTAHGSRVTGVHIQKRGGGGGSADLEADLVVDASGRNSKALSWLSALGCEVPTEEVVDAFIGYSSRWYEVPPPAPGPENRWWKVVWLDPAPPKQFLGGVLFPVEDGRCIVTLIGYSRHYPPSDEEGFMRALNDVRSPVLARMVARAKPISSVYSNRALVNRRRRFEKLRSPVAGFIALSDSVCTFNPMFGQGMTVATLCAAALEDTLAKLEPRDSAFVSSFFAAQAAYIRDAWSLATSADARFPDTKSDKPPPTQFAKLFGTAVQLSVLGDVEVLKRTTPIYHMLRPNSDIFARDLVARIMVSAAREKLLQRLQGPLPLMPPGRI